MDERKLRDRLEPSSKPPLTKPNAFALYTVVFLHFEGRYLLLKRAPSKRLAPNRWTGVGGRVEAEETGDLRAAALRELTEETSLREEDLTDLHLRRALYHNRAGEPLTGLLYYTANLKTYALPECTEGTLHWLEPKTFSTLDIIETTAQTLPELLEDVRRDPEGLEPPRIGIAHYREDGRLERLSWSA